MKAINSQVTLNISWDYSKDSTPIDMRGIFQYAECKSTENLKKCLENPRFLEKYKSLDNIKR